MRNIVLIGMMGSGKSSTGRALAQMLGWSFFDSDAEIEKDAKQTISEIFASVGEGEFRKMEKSTIARLSQNARCVLAVGGGAACFEENWIAWESSLVLWLQVSAAEVLRRAQFNVGSRPLLQNAPSLQTIEELIQKRDAFYSRAQAAFASDGLSPEAVAKNLFRWLQEKFSPKDFA